MAQQNEDDRIMWAIKNGDLDQVKEIIEEKQFNVNLEIAGRYPIHYAADYGQTDVLNYLLSKGADVDVSRIKINHFYYKYLCMISLSCPF